ncbi:MAG: hypothetical protein WC346_05415 [Methanogenium sp.]|jgi:starvation-inducible outer membrane lipoprotein
MNTINLISLPARGEFISYSNRFFYGQIVKVVGNNITIKGTIGKGRYKKIKYYTFDKSKVEIYV